MSAAGGVPTADVTGRMAVFGRLFGEEMGVPEPAAIPTAGDAVELVRQRVPRGQASDESPVLEAAAYLGEWLRARTDAIWIAEGPREPLLQVVDGSRAIVHLIPVIELLRTAASAGYDGLAALLDHVVQDVSVAARPTPIEEMRVVPESERAAVVAWARRYQGIRDATRAALWRRCQTCSTPQEDGLTLHHVGEDWEGEAAMAASILAHRPFSCLCGGPPGETTRFLMLRADAEGERLCEIRASGSSARVACWKLDEGLAIPYDATTFHGDGSMG